MADRLDGNFAPVTRECHVADLPVRGELPPELRGALFRNGPNPQFPTDHAGAHWFTGDGMLHAIRLEAGRAAYSNRWIRTPKFLAEQQAGRSLFGGYAGRLGASGEERDFRAGVANTHVVFHAGRLLALEEQHLPVEIDPGTLETVGFRDWDGGLAGPFTAHPKVDPATGEMIFFGYHVDAPRGPGLHWGTVDRSGRLTRFERIDAPYASMVHDFIVTADHVAFPIMPLTASLARQRAGGSPYVWDRGFGTQVGVIRRDQGAASLRWIRGETGFVFHVMNAFEHPGAIVADIVEHATPPLFPSVDGGDPLGERGGRLARWTIPLDDSSDMLTSHPLDDVPGEFPRIDDRVAGVAHRHGWMAVGTGGTEALNGIAHHDLATGGRAVWGVPAGDGVSEAVFAPRGTAEGDGWLLAVAYRGAERASDLLVFEATDLAQGPIATVRLPQRVPFGFHGSWMPAS